MSQTQIFRRQHDALELLAADFMAALGTCKTELQARDCARTLAKLTGILLMHLAAEDRSLYPRMMASQDVATAQTAHRFAEEMGGLAGAYRDFNAKWSRAEAILADVPGCMAEAQSVFAALGNRIARENDELYPLADQMGRQSAAA